MKNNLRNAGLKITVPRLKILNILVEANNQQSNNRHLSAEAIYQELVQSGEDVGLATVYRVLTQFEAAGLIVKHNFESDQSVFELAKGEHHDHLICIKCHTVEEFLDPLIEDRQQEIAHQTNFKITHHALNIYGLCRKCH